ncbi:unnamed protein product [Parnassius apollo]|uniref:(apollo) hypothetical protein n=1 Tax=Parnassius apollo TaxID=110799 RepID=A0A8S3W0T8_PARAO|nr:unnamed protein product [Parnassius apollo]
MELLETIIFTLQISNVITKKHVSSSEESIENLIYYKDCNHKRKQDAPPVKELLTRTNPPPPPQECKMYCSMCCGGECVHDRYPSIMSRQSPTMLENSMPKPQPFQQPVLQPPLNQKGKKKQTQLVSGLQPPIGGRRNVEFTRQHIKSLISQDQDIRKILKDLVRVTMQKVDLLEMINSRRSVNEVNSEENKSEADSLE